MAFQGRPIVHPARHPRPAHLHPHAVGQPVMAARLQPAFGDGADQQPPRPQLQLRDPLHPRACEDESPYRAGAGGDDGRCGPATQSGCARWSVRCRCAIPADPSAAFRHRRSTGPAAGRGTPQPSMQSCSCIVPILRGIAGLCSPGRTRRDDIGHTRTATRAGKLPQRTYLYVDCALQSFTTPTKIVIQ